MKIPEFTCTKCDTVNPERESNLRANQDFFNIRSVATECKSCCKQKIIQVIP